MDNLQQIECHQRICHLFSSLNLHAENLFLRKKILSLSLFKITTLSRPSSLLRVFLVGRLKCLTKGSEMGGSPCNRKSLNFPLLLNITPTKELSPPVSPLITDHILEKSYIWYITYWYI